MLKLVVKRQFSAGLGALRGARKGQKPLNALLRRNREQLQRRQEHIERARAPARASERPGRGGGAPGARREPAQRAQPEPVLGDIVVNRLGPVAAQDTPEGGPKTPQGGPKTPQGAPKTPQGGPKTPQGARPLQALKLGRYGALRRFTEDELERSQALLRRYSSFEDLQLLPYVRRAVQNCIRQTTILSTDAQAAQDMSRSVPPTPIQIAAIRTVSARMLSNELKVHTIAAETGSGKTMAYGSLLAEFLKREEANDASARGPGRIRAVVMVPTHELVDQVDRLIGPMAHELDIRVFRWDVSKTHHDLLAAYREGIDVLVCTPGKLDSVRNIRMLDRPKYVFSKVKFLVIDEADTLFDHSWVDETVPVLNNMSGLKQVLLCSATIPDEFTRAIVRYFPNSRVVTTPALHRIPKKIQFVTVDAELAPFKGSKMKALAQTLYAVYNDVQEKGYEKKVIVFVNHKKEIEHVADTMRREYGHDVVALSGDDSVEERSVKLKPFITPSRRIADIEADEEAHNLAQRQQLEETPQDEPEHPLPKDEPEHPLPKDVKIPLSNITLKARPKPVSKKRMKVLVTSDLLSRGLNFFNVRNVILYDLPNTSQDFVHRVGRTGRMNTIGRVFLIVDKKNNKRQSVTKLPSTIRNNGLIV